MPQLAGTESVLLAVGILGATVMPHVIFLHSSLTQSRIVVREPRKLQRLLRFEIADVGIAMGLAGIINMAMLIMAAQTFHVHGMTNIATIPDAHKTLQPLLGTAASWVFAISLLASGLSSSSVGTMAGQVIMQGFIHRQIPAWIRRLVTMIPSVAVIVLGVDPTRALVLSQVVLSFALPFPVIPLIFFTRRKDVMGVLVNKPLTTVAGGPGGGCDPGVERVSYLPDLRGRVTRCSSTSSSPWTDLASRSRRSGWRRRLRSASAHP